LIFGFVSLTAATTLVFKFIRLLYTHEALKLDPTVVVSVKDILSLMDSLAFINSFLVLIWTAIFFVKFSFLALFRLLLKHVSKKITIYFWVVVGYCIVTWLLLVSEAFIVCPYFGEETSKCPLSTILHLNCFRC
jgi:hypothetical protein